MLKNITQFKATIDGVESIFHFEQNCPIATAKEAILQCLKWIGQVEDQSKAMQEAKAKADADKSNESVENKIEELQA